MQSCSSLADRDLPYIQYGTTAPTNSSSLGSGSTMNEVRCARNSPDPTTPSQRAIAAIEGSPPPRTSDSSFVPLHSSSVWTRSTSNQNQKPEPEPEPTTTAAVDLHDKRKVCQTLALGRLPVSEIWEHRPAGTVGWFACPCSFLHRQRPAIPLTNQTKAWRLVHVKFISRVGV